MFSILLWQPLQVAKGSRLRFSVTGNVNTRVATRYFWIPTKGQPSVQSWTLKDGEPLELDSNLIAIGQDNRLGFACQLAPVAATDLALHATFLVRQGSAILLEQVYSGQATSANTPEPLADGVALHF